jgi:cytochrome P450
MKPFNPLHPAVLADPYPAYAAYRAQQPVHWGLPGDETAPGTWYVFRFDDAQAALKDQRLGREVWRIKPPPPVAPEFKTLGETMAHWMILRDPPAHTHLRGLVSKAFTPRVAEGMRPRIAWHADRLLDGVRAAGRMDVIADFARLLPTLIIAEAIGVPSEDCALFLPWAVALAQTIEFKPTDAVRHSGTAALLEMRAYLRDLLTNRRTDPRDDVLTGLLRAEEDGCALSDDDIFGTITLLLTAGNDPTQHMIGNGVLALLRHPAALAWLRAHSEAMETATDELLRYDSSVQATFRYALEDVVMGGQAIAAGDHVAIVFGSALRDPAYCDQPDTLDLTRKNAMLPYGFGPHFCLGMPLARAISQVAFDRLLMRLPDLALVTDQVEWEERVAVRGAKALPVVFDCSS